VNTSLFSKSTELELLQAFARLVSISSNFLYIKSSPVSLLKKNRNYSHVHSKAQLMCTRQNSC